MNKKFCKFGLIFFTLITSHALHATPKDNTENQQSHSKENTKSTSTANNIFQSVYEEAKDWLHTPYRYGGTGHKGIDCSAFTGKVYQNVFGIRLERTSKAMSKDVESISKDELKPGDLVFFATRGKKKIVNHVGVYLGKGDFVHASLSKGVTISSLDEKYYQRTWVKGGRVKNLVQQFNKMHLEEFLRNYRVESEVPLLESRALVEEISTDIIVDPLALGNKLNTL